MQSSDVHRVDPLNRLRNRGNLIDRYGLAKSTVGKTEVVAQRRIDFFEHLVNFVFDLHLYRQRKRASL